MGLTAHSTGLGAVDGGCEIHREQDTDRVIALAGNPNVGKSTVFNALTGMNQHTGNWPGKTVTNAQGRCRRMGRDYIMVDLPGTYSLMAHSAEEEVARDFICFGGADAAAVVCDATCLERNLNLVLQTMEITPNVVVCVNLCDEAEKKKIRLDLAKLERRLGVPVVGTSARGEEGLDELMARLCAVADSGPALPARAVRYTEPIERACEIVEAAIRRRSGYGVPERWLALRMIDYDESLRKSFVQSVGRNPYEDEGISQAVTAAWAVLEEAGYERDTIRDRIVSCIVLRAEEVCRGVVFQQKQAARAMDRRLDKLLTSRLTGIPIMIALLCAVFWLTITGSNYPSQLLSAGLFRVQDWLTQLFVWMGAPSWLHGAVVLGIYRTLAWVVSVMLPPMAIFFPLFTLLEDFGYLPRVAFNLDHYFKKARTCGKQALTMCMGFGCNAAGIVGCRIIDSPRERLIAILTNNFVPCNGRFPALIAIITMFFAGAVAAPFQSVFSTFLLTGVILLGILLTFLVSRLLSGTILKGIPSSFTLELPPYRRPQIGKVIVRSLLDRTLFVLGRAAAVAAPAGLVIWLLANITAGDQSLLAHCSAFLDPFGRLLGLDGVILLAFILGFPANEIVIPVMIMAYMAAGTLTDLSSLPLLKALLVDHGWTWATAVSFMLFCLIHWPCSTACLTIGRETKSLRWTAAAIILPTAIGMAACFLFTSAVRLAGWAG